MRTRRLENEKLTDLQRSVILSSLGKVGSSIEDHPAANRLKDRYLKKLQLPSDDEEKLKRLALEDFLSDDLKNKETNLRWRSTFHVNRMKMGGHFWSDVSREILRIVGESPNLRSVARRCVFGPGASFAAKRPYVHASDKFSRVDVTPQLRNIGADFIRTAYPAWSLFLTDSDSATPLLSVVGGSKFSTVYKNRETRRTILIEPTINSWFQQGFGRELRARFSLKTHIDLNDQSANQAAALHASIFDDLATLDLKSASNLIPKIPIKYLWPIRWFAALDTVRSHFCKLPDGTYHEMEMFSSMGNGFTFDVMSITLYAIAKVSCDHSLDSYDPKDVLVFGDDVILPKGAVATFVGALEEFGMVVNHEKSFLSGPFRESCGWDCYRGELIKPFYVRRLDRSFDLVVLHNRICDWCSRHPNILRRELQELRSLLRNMLPDVPKIPPSLGDAGFWGTWDEVCPPLNPYGWEDVYLITYLKPRLQKRDRDDRFMLLSKLAQSSWDFDGNTISPPQEIASFTIARFYALWRTP